MNKFAELTLLLLISTLCVWERIRTIFKYGWLIHEYDPWFNYRMAEFLDKNGVWAFFTWHDDKVWYPAGRNIAKTTYPGMMLITVALKRRLTNILHLEISLEKTCVLIPCIFSVVSVFLVFKIVKFFTRNEVGPLFAAYCMSILPAYFSRSQAGAYDYESVSITLMLLCILNWLKLLVFHKAYIVFTEFWLLLMAASWGGYVFILNVIMLHILSMIVLHKEWKSKHRLLLYLLFCSLTQFALYFIPCIREKVLISVDHALVNVTFAILLTLLAMHYKMLKLHLLVPVVVAAAAIAVKYRTCILIGERVKMIIGMKKSANPLALSIGEHQPSTWTNLYSDFHITLVITGSVINKILRKFGKISRIELFIAIFTLSSVYFAASMVRLNLILSPATCICSGIWMGKYCKRLGRLFIFILSVIFFVHSRWINKTLYSNPMIVAPINNGKFLDDFRESYLWMKSKTPEDSKIAAWWDYGYQINGIANRTTFVDNHTSNFKQIAKIALFLLSNEQEAFKLCKEMKIDFVMVVSGCIVGFNGDDLNKLGWMATIAGHYFPLLISLESFRDRAGNLSIEPENASPVLVNSLLYKLTYFQLHFLLRDNFCPLRRQNFYIVEKLSHFEPVFISSNFIIRIYRPKKD